jgi:hypothetical protein
VTSVVAVVADEPLEIVILAVVDLVESELVVRLNVGHVERDGEYDFGVVGVQQRLAIRVKTCKIAVFFV